MATTPSASGKLIDVDMLSAALDGKELPGAIITIERYESALADYALLAPEADSSHAHPLWLLILALRGMGITVDELCELAGKRAQDTLLFGNCAMTQHRPMCVGNAFAVTATIESVARKETKRGGFLDFVTVRATIFDKDNPSDAPAGEVVNGFIFKRGA